MKNRFIYTDNTIRIQPFRPEDAERHVRGEDEEIRKWLNEGHTSTIESVLNIVRSWQDDGDIFPFAIWTVDDETLVGMVEARTHWRTIEGLEEGDANISYCLYPDFRGKGYMPRAINLIREFLVTKGIRRAVIRIDPDNSNSLKVPPRCGFRETGHLLTENERIYTVFVRGID